MTPTFALHRSGTPRDIPGVAQGNVQIHQEHIDPPSPAPSPKPGRRDREEGVKRGRQAVVIVDRNLLFRAGLAQALKRTRFQILAECSTLEEVPLEHLAAEHPLVLMMGLDTARIAAMQVALRDFRRLSDDLHVVMFYDRMFPLPPEMADMGRLADAFLPTDEIGSESVIKAVDLVLLGASVISKELLSRMATGNEHTALENALVTRVPEATAIPEALNVLSRSAQEHGVDSLTVRERLILSHLMKGASNKAIARDLGIAESTVKIHVRNLMLKIDAKNRTQVAMWGFKYLA